MNEGCKGGLCLFEVLSRKNLLSLLLQVWSMDFPEMKNTYMLTQIDMKLVIKVMFSIPTPFIQSYTPF